MTWTGTLEFQDLGPGAWVLKTDDGKKIALYGDIPKDLAGKRVDVEGSSGVMGISMVGSDAVKVTKVSRAR